MSLKTEKLSQLEVLESAEGTHVLVEQDGTHKRVPAAKIVGGSASIDVTATVGQTIVVTEVDANGKPTKWKAEEYQPRTHWTEIVELLPEMTIPLEDGGSEIPNSPYKPEEGKRYRITWNGAVYECVAKQFVDAESGTVGIGVGNSLLAGGEDTGEPFAMGYISAYGVSVIMSIDETVTSATIKVEGEVATPIPVEYVSNAFPYYIEVTGSGTDEDPYAVKETVAELTAIFNSGRDMAVKAHTDFGGFIVYSVYRLFQYGNSAYGYGMGFFFTTNADTETKNRYVILAPQEDGSFGVEIRSYAYGDS